MFFFRMYFLFFFILTIQREASRINEVYYGWQIKVFGSIWQGQVDLIYVDFSWYVLPGWGLEL